MKWKIKIPVAVALIGAVGAIMSAYVSSRHHRSSVETVISNTHIAQGNDGVAIGSVILNQPQRQIAIPAERYTNVRRLGEHLIADYLLVELQPDGRYKIIQSKTPGVNLVFPTDVLLQIQGKWIVEESDIARHPDRGAFHFTRLVEFNHRVLFQVDI